MPMAMLELLGIHSYHIYHISSEPLVSIWESAHLRHRDRRGEPEQGACHHLDEAAVLWTAPLIQLLAAMPDLHGTAQGDSFVDMAEVVLLRHALSSVLWRMCTPGKTEVSERWAWTSSAKLFGEFPLKLLRDALGEVEEAENTASRLTT